MDDNLLKKKYLEVYEQTLGNHTKTCKLINVSRQKMYNLLNSDEEFRTAVESIEPKKQIVDSAKEALLAKISEGDTTAIIFTLKTLGKDEGFIEKVQTEHSGEINMPKIELVLPSE